MAPESQFHRLSACCTYINENINGTSCLHSGELPSTLPEIGFFPRRRASASNPTEGILAVWRHFNVPQAGYCDAFSEALSRANGRFDDLLWPTDTGFQTIFSDYSGQHKGATHESYSFLVTTWEDLESWLPLREQFRARWLPDGRRLSFKQLREPLRRKAYPHFLELFGQLRANLLTFMVDYRVGSFSGGSPKELASVFPECFLPGASDASIEKTHRLAILVAMIQAGLRDERQESVWISDHDETLDTFEKREGIARLASYFVFGLVGWRNPADQTFTTTADTKLPEWVEDVAAMPDIAAGASARLSEHLPTFQGSPTWTVPVRYESAVDWRARTFGDWLSTPNGTLRHVLLRLSPDDKGVVRASAQTFLRWNRGQAMMKGEARA